MDSIPEEDWASGRVFIGKSSGVGPSAGDATGAHSRGKGFKKKRKKVARPRSSLSLQPQMASASSRLQRTSGNKKPKTAR